MTLIKHKDVPEGFRYSELPRGIGYGRILSGDSLDERYVSLRLMGRVFYIVSGRYSAWSGNNTVSWRTKAGRV